MEDYLENLNDNVFVKSFNRVEFEITAEVLPGNVLSLTALPMLGSLEPGFKLILAVYGPANGSPDSPDGAYSLEDLVDNALGALYDQFIEQVFEMLVTARKKKLINELL